MSLRPLAALATLLLAGLLCRDAWPPDEARYADVALGISQGAGWSVPHLQGVVYREKPAAAFWLAAGLIQLGVPASVAPRAVSGLAALATLALLPGIASALGLARSSAARAGWVLTASPLFLAYAQAGMLDASATAWVTAAIAAKLARAGRPRGVRAGLVACEALALAAALLTKGPVLLLFPLGMRLGAAFARERSAASADASDAAALGLALCAVGAALLPTEAAAGAGYVKALALGQLLRRVSGDAPHLRPPGWLLGVTLIGLLPWTLLGVPILRLRSAWRARTETRPGAASAALLGWTLLPALLLAMLRTQQPHYLLPALPALALLFAQAVATPERWALRGAGMLALIASSVLWIRALAAPVFTDNPAELALAADVPLRLVCAVTAAFLLALLLAPAAARFAPWVRAVAGIAALAITAIVGLARLDPWMSPRALLADDAVLHAESLAAPQNAVSSLRILSGRGDVITKSWRSVADWLAAGEGRVAFVWKRDLERLALGAESFEEIGRGYLGARSLVALRAAPAARARSNRVP